MSLSAQTYATGVVVLVTLYVFIDIWRRRSLPPGPRGFPIIGNLLEMPKTEEWLYWANLGQIYGTSSLSNGPPLHRIHHHVVQVLLAPFAYLASLSSSSIRWRYVTSYSASAQQYILAVLCSHLLGKCTRSCHFIGFFDLEHRHRVGWDQQLILSQVGERHTAMRKMVNRFIGTKSAVAALSSVQEAEARWFVLRMSEAPQKVLSHIRLYVSYLCRYRRPLECV